jgi:hypothetical protein
MGEGKAAAKVDGIQPRIGTPSTNRPVTPMRDAEHSKTPNELFSEHVL